MKSKGMLNVAPECYKKPDGVEAFLESCEEPLDLRIKSNQSFEGLKPGTDNTEVNSPQHSKMDVEISEPNTLQSSVRYAEAKIEVHTDCKTSQTEGQHGISVIRPKPIYCCQTQNTNSNNTGIMKDHNCLNKTFYQAASASNLDSISNHINSMLKAPNAHRWNFGTNVSQGIMGMFRRKAYRDSVKKSYHQNSGPVLGRFKKLECNSMKFKNGHGRKKSPETLVLDRNIPDSNMEAATNGQYKVGQMGRSAVGMCGITTFDGLNRSGDHGDMYGRDSLDIGGAVSPQSDKDMPDLGPCPGILKEATDTSSENDNSFEVLFEYLSNRDEQSSLQTLPYTEEVESEHKLPVLQGCEDILDPMPDKDRIFEVGGEIPDLELVEPSVSPTVDFMEDCRLSPFSVFNQFSQISQHPDPVLFPMSSLSFTPSEDEDIDEEDAVIPQHTIRPVATVFPFQEASVKTYSGITRPALCHESNIFLHKEKSLDQQHGKEQETTTTGVENTVLDLSTSRSRPSLSVQHTSSEKELKGMSPYNQGKRILYSSKPTLSFLNKIPTDTVVSYFRRKSTSSLGEEKLTPLLCKRKPKLSSPAESAVFPNRESVLPLLQKEWTLFSQRESGLPSLHEESTRFSLRESALPSLHRESNSITSLLSEDKESTIFTNTESNVSLTTTESQGESFIMSSSRGESLMSSSQGKSHLSLSQGKSHLSSSQGESHMSSSQGESHMSSSQGESHMLSSQGKSHLSSFRWKSLMSSSQGESLMSSSQGESHMSSPQGESLMSSSQGESHMSSSQGKSLILSSQGESHMSSSQEESLIMTSSQGESQMSSSPGETLVSSSEGEFLMSSSQREPTLYTRKDSTVLSLNRTSSIRSSEEESISAFSCRDSLPNHSDKTGLNMNIEGKSSPELSMSSQCKPIFSMEDMNSDFASDFERDMKMLSMFYNDLEKSCQGISQKMTSIEPESSLVHLHSSSTPKSAILKSTSAVKSSPLLTSLTDSPVISSLPNLPVITCMLNAATLISVPNLHMHTTKPNSSIVSSIPNSQMITSMSNLPISTSPIPNSPILASVSSLHALTSSISNSHILASLQNSSSISSSWLNLPNSQILTFSVSNSPRVIYSTPKLPTLTATVPKSPSPKISSMSEIQITTSVPNSPISNFISPISMVEKYKEQGARLSPPMKHKQMLIEKYKMSVNIDQSGSESTNNQCDKELHEITRVENSTMDLPRTSIARKHQLCPTSKCLSFSESENQGNSCSPAKERKLLTEESKYNYESVFSNQSLQPHDLKPCETFYWCHVCEKTIKCEKEASRHQSIHGYNTKANLIFYYLQVYGCVTLHWRGYNRADKCVYLCGLCDKTIPYISGFKRHIQTHGHDVCCEDCDRCFDGMESLLEHRLSHLESKSCDENGDQRLASRTNKHGNTGKCSSATNKCRFCGKFFSSRSSLTIHVRLHTGQNPYKCRLCDRSYPQNIQLKLHMKAHRRLGGL